MTTDDTARDARSFVLDRMMAEAKCDFRSAGYDLKILHDRKVRIIDYIMTHADLALTAEQIRFFDGASPRFDQDRADYFDVLDRMFAEAWRLGETQLARDVCATVPIYEDDMDAGRKAEFVLRGARELLASGKRHYAGELYASLACSFLGIGERIVFCDRALEYLDKASADYAAALALRRLLGRMAHRPEQKPIHYHAYGEGVRCREGRIVTTMELSHVALFCRHEMIDSLCSTVPVLFGPGVIADETLDVGAAARTDTGVDIIRLEDERVFCQADGKEYVCRAFLSDPEITPTVKSCFAPGVGLVRAILSASGTGREYVFDLCEYAIKGGEGLLPLCVGNIWRYRQLGCGKTVSQTIEREIVSKADGEFHFACLDYAERI